MLPDSADMLVRDILRMENAKTWSELEAVCRELDAYYDSQPAYDDFRRVYEAIKTRHCKRVASTLAAQGTKMGTLKDDLIAAKALIDTPEKWGKEWDTGVRNDIQWYCTAGAIWSGYDRSLVSRRRCAAAESALTEALSPLHHPGIRTFNDDEATTHADVMALFQRAIDACED